MFDTSCSLHGGRRGRGGEEGEGERGGEEGEGAHVENWVVATRLTIWKEPEIAIVDDCMISFVESIPQALCKMFY